MGKNALGCTAPGDDRSPQYTKQFAVRPINGCMNTSVVAAGDFAVTTAEFYRQECRSDFHGRNNMHSETSEMVTMQSHIQSNLRGKKGNGDWSLADDNSLAETSQGPGRREIYGDDRKKKKNGHRAAAAKDPAGSPPRRHYHMGDEEEFDFSPPRVDRTSAAASEFDPRAGLGNLMEARMELYRLGQDGVSPPENKLARALQDLKRQDKVIDGWKRQLEMAQKHLDETFAELEQTKKDSQEKQRKATEMRARAVQERKKFQDMYEAEVEQRKKLDDSVAKLQNEISTLKVTLRNARGTSAAAASSPSSRAAPESVSQTQIMALKAEVVDLRSQLAEAHAVNLDDHSAVHTTGDSDELKLRLNAAEKELDELRSKDGDMMAVRKNYEDSGRLLHEKIERMEREFKATRRKLEENLKAAVDEENLVRSELNKFKANCQRLERERSRTRIHSAADFEKVNKQLCTAKDEAVQLKEQLTLEKAAAKEEVDKLKHEIHKLQQKLRETGRGFPENVSIATEEQSKLESELTILREEIEMRKQQLKVKSEETASQASRIAELESLSKDAGLQSSSQQVQSLEDEVKALKVNEASLRDDITTLQASIEQERKQTIKAQSLLRAQYVNESVRLGQFRREAEEYKQADKGRSEQEEVIAKLRREIIVLEKKVEVFQRKADIKGDTESKVLEVESAHKSEMASLMAKLSEMEAKYGEECLRADEERRLGKENNARYEQELEEMRRENEKNSEDKMKLREELEELRKQLANGITGAVGRSLATTEGFDQSTKVNKLRSELALARARLAAAREQNGQFTTQSTSATVSSVPITDDNVSCDQSASSSLGSSWVPRKSDVSRDRFTTLKEENSPLDEEPQFEDEHDALADDIPVDEKKEDYPERSEHQVLIDAPLTEVPSDEPIPTTRGEVAPRIPPSYGHGSLIDAEEDHEALPESSRPPRPRKVGDESSNSIPVRTSVEELRRQLRESSKRLELANSRLNSLAHQDLPKSTQMNFFSSSPFRGINHNIISSLENPDTSGGILDEMVTGEDGEIEVQQVRYADI
jgi:hypothetical protein